MRICAFMNDRVTQIAVFLQIDLVASDSRIRGCCHIHNRVKAVLAIHLKPPSEKPIDSRKGLEKPLRRSHRCHCSTAQLDTLGDQPSADRGTPTPLEVEARDQVRQDCASPNRDPDSPPAHDRFDYTDYAGALTAPPHPPEE
jgi:hypothetical protein